MDHLGGKRAARRPPMPGPITTQLVPNIPDSGKFVSGPLSVPQNTPISVQTYTSNTFSIEISIDGITFYPLQNITLLGIFRIDCNGGSVMRLRADSVGEAPYALFLSDPT